MNAASGLQYAVRSVTILKEVSNALAIRDIDFMTTEDFVLL